MKRKHKRRDRERSSESEDNIFHLSADGSELDFEAARQSDLMHDACVALADARLAFNDAEDELEVVAAEIELDVRENPKRYRLKNVTEAAIKAKVRVDERYTKIAKRIRQRRHAMDIRQAAVTGLEHKKRMMEKMIDMHGMHFFSDVKVRGDMRDIVSSAKQKRAFKPLDDEE